MTSSARPWASVVIPIKDERENLAPLTERVLKVLDARGESRTASYELLYIDDGSTDGSSELLDELARRIIPPSASFISTGTMDNHRPSTRDSNSPRASW